MPKRVAFFTDSFHEVNGVALTSRQFHAYAQKHALPFLSVHAGPETVSRKEGDVVTLELERGPGSFALENDLAFDLFLWRYRSLVIETLRSFQPDLVHVTGPGDFGMLAAYAANRLGVPLVASWHTNVHEYAGRRLEKLLSSVFPTEPLHRLGAAAERRALAGTALFYRIAELLFAPNRELVAMLQERTGKPCFLMQRGVDADLFSPLKRPVGERPFTIGYVGRLSTEKNVRFLADIERSLLDAGHSDFRLLIAGAGADHEWLSANLTKAEFTGIAKGENLARVYASMDVFVFPSETDTFGNVILEALASGVPAVVTSGGGPKFLIDHGLTGFIANDSAEFLAYVAQLYSDRALQRQMSVNARAYADDISWDRVFEKVYEAYECLT
jgi:phosphatidylinositol alpha 1,6-mannosyltransferase